MYIYIQHKLQPHPRAEMLQSVYQISHHTSGFTYIFSGRKKCVHFILPIALSYFRRWGKTLPLGCLLFTIYSCINIKANSITLRAECMEYI